MTGRDLAKRFMGHWVWNLVAGVSARGLTMALWILMSHHVTAEIFGAFSLLATTLTTLSAFAAVGLGGTALRQVAFYRTSDPLMAVKTIWIAFITIGIVSIPLSALIILFAGTLSTSLFGHDGYAWGVQIIAVAMALMAIANVAANALAGYERFREQALLAIVTLVVAGGTALWAVPAFGLVGGLAVLVVIHSINLLLAVVMLLPKLRRVDVGGLLRTEPLHRFDDGILMRYTVPSFMGSILVPPTLWFGQALLAQSEAGVAAVGTFAVAYHWHLIILFLPAVSARVVIALLSNAMGAGDATTVWRVTVISLVAHFLCASVMALAIAALLPLILSFYGDGIDPDAIVPVFHVLAVAAVLISCSDVFTHFIASHAKMWGFLVLNGIWAIAFVSAGLWVVPEGGALGLAYVFLCAFGLLGVLRCLYVVILISGSGLAARGDTPLKRET